ncbi:MAG TPA: HD domain-containing phosphohydrolase [Geothrix sp.]|nr:HD domain-containing phosphohydrolase [Geothrix sp.]
MSKLEPPRRQTILLVDDSPEDVRLLVDLLRGHYRVEVATDGARAIGLAGSSEPPDLILLNLMMPDMDGFEVCRRLKADPGTRGIPVLFLAAMGDVQDEAHGFAAGCADYITKPFSAPVVLARIRIHLKQRQLLLSERELLEKTLMESLAAILELIAMTNPNAATWNHQLGELCEQVALRMGVEEPWRVGLAGVLSRIGTLAVPEAILAKVKSKALLNSEERQIYTRVPEVGYNLLKHIPRLEDVAEMVHYSQKNFRGGGFPPDERTGEDIPLGARILRVCLDFLKATSRREDRQKLVADMLHNLTLYDAEVVFALQAVVETGRFDAPAAEEEGETRDMPIECLMEGHVLDGSVETEDGQILLREGTILTFGHVEKLKNYSLIGAIRGPIPIRVDA